MKPFKPTEIECPECFEVRKGRDEETAKASMVSHLVHGHGWVLSKAQEFLDAVSN